MADTITAIVLFEVPAAQAERFEADWHESNAFMARHPGLIEDTLNRAVTGNAQVRERRPLGERGGAGRCP